MKNKIYLVFFLFFLSFIILFSSEAYASYDFTYEDISYSLPDLPENGENFNNSYYSIYKVGENYVLLSYIGYDPSTMKIINTNENSGFMAIVDLNGNVVSSARTKFWNSDGVSWSLNSWQPSKSWYGYYGGEQISDNFIYSSCSIYLAEGNYSEGYTVSNEFFFSDRIVLMVPMEVEEISEVVKRESIILTKIGLIVFSISSVVFYLFSKIFGMALSKR